MQGVVAATHRSIEGELVSGRGSFGIRSVLASHGCQKLGGLVTYFSVIEL